MALIALRRRRDLPDNRPGSRSGGDMETCIAAGLAALALAACFPGPLAAEDVGADATVSTDTSTDDVAVSCEADAACDDHDPCTADDRCVDARCKGTAKVCTPTACQASGACDPSDGQCHFVDRDDGDVCDDGLKCTRDDACKSGVCAGEAVVCEALDACHTAGVCEPATGACANPNADFGSPCDDGQRCTAIDSCQSGDCVGTGAPIDELDDWGITIGGSGGVHVVALSVDDANRIHVLVQAPVDESSAEGMQVYFGQSDHDDPVYVYVPDGPRSLIHATYAPDRTVVDARSIGTGDGDLQNAAFVPLDAEHFYIAGSVLGPFELCGTTISDGGTDVLTSFGSRFAPACNVEKVLVLRGANKLWGGARVFADRTGCIALLSGASGDHLEIRGDGTLIDEITVPVEQVAESWVVSFPFCTLDSSVQRIITGDAGTGAAVASFAARRPGGGIVIGGAFRGGVHVTATADDASLVSFSGAGALILDLDTSGDPRWAMAVRSEATSFGQMPPPIWSVAAFRDDIAAVSFTLGEVTLETSDGATVELPAGELPEFRLTLLNDVGGLRWSYAQSSDLENFPFAHLVAGPTRLLFAGTYWFSPTFGSFPYTVSDGYVAGAFGAETPNPIWAISAVSPQAADQPEMPETESAPFIAALRDSAGVIIAGDFDSPALIGSHAQAIAPEGPTSVFIARVNSADGIWCDR
ncbi:MAG: hypothetical protein U1F43_06925 [Myxococcota bacterium]